MLKRYLLFDDNGKVLLHKQKTSVGFIRLKELLYSNNFDLSEVKMILNHITVQEYQYLKHNWNPLGYYIIGQEIKYNWITMIDNISLKSPNHSRVWELPKDIGKIKWQFIQFLKYEKLIR